MVELYLHSPVCLHGIVLNELSTGTTLPLLAEFCVYLLVTAVVLWTSYCE
jgi:hypothetical protein